MKNKAFNLSSRCLAFFLSLLMAVSCFSAVTLSVSAAEPSVSEDDGEISASQSGTSFSDGVYTLTVDVDALFEMIDNGSVSLEEVKKLLPQELLDAITTDGGVNDKITALLRAYINLTTGGDMKKLTELLPVDMTIDYLTRGEEPLLWRVISKEALMESVDLVAIFNDLNASGELESIIDIEAAADVALDGGLIDEAAINAIIDDLKKNDAAAYDKLVEKVADMVLNNSEFEEIRDSVIDTIANDDAAIQQIADIIQNDEDILNELSKNVDTDKLKELVDEEVAKKLADKVDKEALAELVDGEVLKKLFENNAIDVEEFLNFIDVTALIENGAIDIAGLMALISSDDLKALIENGAIDISGLMELISSDDLIALIESGAIDIAGLMKLIPSDDLKALVESEAIDIQGLLQLIRKEDLEELITDGVIDIKGIIANIEENTLNGLVDVYKLGELIDTEKFANLITDDTDKLSAFYESLSSDEKDAIAEGIDRGNTDAFKNYFNTLDDDDIKKLPDALEGEVQGTPASDSASDIIDFLVEQIDSIDPVTLFNALKKVDSNIFVHFIDCGILAPADIVAAVDAGTIINSNIVATDAVINAVDIEDLLDEDVFDIYEVVNTLSMSDILAEITDISQVMDKVMAAIDADPYDDLDSSDILNCIDDMNAVKAQVVALDHNGLFDNINDIGAVMGVIDPASALDYIDIEAVIDVVGNIDPADLLEADIFKFDAIREYLSENGNIDDIINEGIVEVSAVLDVIEVSDIIDKNIVAVSDVITAIGASKIIKYDNNGKIIEIDAVVEALGGVSELLDRGIVDEQDFMDKAGDSLRDIVLTIGADELVNICGFTRIINAIGIDRLVSNEQITALVDYVELVRILINNGYIQTIDREALMAAVDKAAIFEVASMYIINFTKSLSINGTEIFSSLDAKLDVNLLTQVLAESVPTFDTLAEDPENAFSFVIDWALNESEINPETTKSGYSFGIKVKLTGDTERFAKLCEKLSGYVSIVNVGERTNIIINAPAKLATLYLKAVNTDRIPESLKTKLLSYTDMEISEDNAEAVIADFTVEEIITIIENTDFSNATAVIDKLNGIYSDAYSRALAIAKRAVNAMSADKLVSVAERFNIGVVADKLENNQEKIRELKDKLIEYIDLMSEEELNAALENGTFGDYNTLLADDVRANADILNAIRSYILRAVNKAFDYAPDKLLGTRLSDLYIADGHFKELNANVSYDILPKLEELMFSRLPETAKEFASGFLKGTEITRDVTFKLTLNNIYEAKFVNNGETLFVTYLPAGAKLSAVYQVPSLKGYTDGWTYDGSETKATVMPANDATFILYNPEHVDHDMIKIDELAPTCEDPGYEIWKCQFCDYTEQIDFPALGHIPEEHWRIEKGDYPTKSGTGRAIKRCTREGCNKIVAETTLPKLPDATNYFYHVTPVQEGPCDEWTILYEFVVDEDMFTYEISANASHTWGEWEIITEPTMKDEGLRKHTCTVCGTEAEDVMSSLGSIQNTLVDSNTGIRVSGTFADGKEYSLTVDKKDYDASVWGEYAENMDIIDIMDIHVAGLGEGFFDYAIGLVVQIPIDPAYKPKEIYVLHQLSNGTIETFSTDYAEVDEDHQIRWIDIPSFTMGTIPAIEFTVHSFSTFSVVTPHEHEFGEWKGTAPTLTSGGSYTRTCTADNGQCDKDGWKETIDLPELNSIDYDCVFTPDTTGATAGTASYRYVDADKAFDKTFDVIHEWGEWTVEYGPTADIEGLLVRECTIPYCENSCYTELTLPKLIPENGGEGQFYTVTEELNGNCGLRTLTYKFTVGEGDGAEQFEFTVEAPIDHTWSDWTVTKPATIFEKGEEQGICSICGETETREIPIVPSSDKEITDSNGQVSISGTFADGYEHTVIVEDLVDDQGNYDKSIWAGITNIDNIDMLYVWDISISEESDGLYDSANLKINIPINPIYKNRKFVVFHYKNDGTIDSYTMDSIEPKYLLTLNADLELEFTIDSFSPFFVGMLHEHTWSEWTVIKAPTKTEAGTLERTCANNSAHKETFTLPALDELLYAYTLVSPATCGEKGVEKYVYSKDGQTFEFKVEIDALTHAYGEWKLAVAPTADTEGRLERVCANDPSHKETHTLPKLNDNDYVCNVVTAPTCTEKGEATYTYTYDGKTFTITAELAALGHSFGEWTVVAEPTLTTEGALERVCANDETHKERHTLPMLNDTDYTYKVVTEPTDNENGLAVYTYTLDGQTFDFEVTLEVRIPQGGEDNGGFWWWWILLIIILVLVIAAAVVFFLIKRNADNNNPPENQPEEEPTAEPEPEPESEEPIAPTAVEDIGDYEEDEDNVNFVVAPAKAQAKSRRQGKKTIVNVGDLSEAFSEGDTASLETLKAKGLVPQSAKRYKVLSNGEIDKALTVEADEFSPQAVEKIEAAGGSAVKVRI